MSSRESEPRTPVKDLLVADLLLDPDNPRLAGTLPEASQEELLQELFRAYDLQPLMQSMSQHGYFSEEPLIGVEPASPNGDVVVVEGNRRLASLKLLLNEEARVAVGVREDQLPTVVNDEVLGSLDPVPVKVYSSRDKIIPYLGVRHIRGVKDWDPLAKARYVCWLLDQGQSIREIAQSIGVQRGTVQRWLLTLHVLDQANKASDKPWDEAPGSFKFSWLYTALGYARVRNYLHLETPGLEAPPLKPVPQEHEERLLEHMHDLYGPPPGKSQSAVVTDSRQLRKLAAIYDSSEALGRLRGGASLEEAYARSAGEKEELLAYLRQIDDRLDRALGMAHRHRGRRELTDLADRITNAGSELLKTLTG